MTTTLEKVRARIIEAVPDKDCPVETAGNHCPTHSLGLADVLRAVEKGEGKLFVREDGSFYVDMVALEVEYAGVAWNLALSLDEQEPEVIAFLAKVLKERV